MKRMILIIAMFFAFTSTAIAASISINESPPYDPGTQVTFTVSGGDSVYNVCGPYGNRTVEILPVVNGQSGPFTVPSDVGSCVATLYRRDKPVRRGGGYVQVRYCLPSGNGCLFD